MSRAADLVIPNGQTASNVVSITFMATDAALSVIIQPPVGLVETVGLQASADGAIFMPVQRPDGVTDVVLVADKLTNVPTISARHFLLVATAPVAKCRDKLQARQRTSAH